MRGFASPTEIPYEWLVRPFEIARRQVALDRDATRRFPPLFERKRARLLASPHGLLRGSAPLFYELLSGRPECHVGPDDRGWIVGDMHIENLGAYRADDSRLVFDLNDFDDCAMASRRYDVLRLATSVVLSGRSFLRTASECVVLAQRLVEAYVDARFSADAFVPPLTDAMLAIVEKASRRSKKDLLDARAPSSKGRRRFIRGPRYLDLPPDMAPLVPELLASYVAALGARAPSRAGSWQVEDAAQRIAGTGSLGRMRFALLVRDDAGEERILDLKEAAGSSVEGGAGDPVRRAAQVVEGARALVEHPPKLLAPVSHPVSGLSFIGRQLTPQEDKLDLGATGDPARQLPDVAARVGYMLGKAHAHGGGAATARWTSDAMGQLVDHALEFAGIYESVYLAYARLTP